MPLIKGDQGEKGDKGERGDKGEKGDQGDPIKVVVVAKTLPEKPPIDPHMLESEARQGVITTIRAQLNFSKVVAQMEGWSIEPFLDEIHNLINEFRN